MSEQFCTVVAFPLLLLIGQTVVALGQRRLNMRMDEGERKRNDARAETEAKRKAEAEWRADMERRMEQFEQGLDEMKKQIDATLRGQLTQMRSDTVHKAHRYLDDLGCASTEEKNAFDAEYQEYARLCDANGIENDFVATLHDQVMALPGRNYPNRD